MLRSLCFISLCSIFANLARAEEICYDMQVCEEVCTEGYTVSDVPLDADLSAARTVRGFQQISLPVTCETVCDIEEYCYPVDTTNGGEGNTYDTDDIDACYQEQLLVDQIRCIQMLGA